MIRVKSISNKLILGEFGGKIRTVPNLVVTLLLAIIALFPGRKRSTVMKKFTISNETRFFTSNCSPRADVLTKKTTLLPVCFSNL